jgi:hypothetical protein
VKESQQLDKLRDQAAKQLPTSDFIGVSHADDKTAGESKG